MSRLCSLLIFSPNGVPNRKYTARTDEPYKKQKGKVRNPLSSSIHKIAKLTVSNSQPKNDTNEHSKKYLLAA